jgi:two-component system chemotaxis response regulator CheB
LSAHRHDIVVIGASAGGVSALVQLATSLPADLSAAVFIVLHVGANKSLLPELMQSRSANPVGHAVDGETIDVGRIYVAPPDRHLLIEGKKIRLTKSPKEHHARPAIDPLFRSAALTYGSRVIGVVLSGRLDDGTAGLQAIKQSGGLAVVQNPDDADEASMPLSALEYVSVDRCVDSINLASTLVELINIPSQLPGNATAESKLRDEHDVSLHRGEIMNKLEAIGKPSTYACPDCDGVLWEINDSKPARFRCHTGHAFTIRSLAHVQATKTEDTLWAAVRALQEQAVLLERLATASNDDDADQFSQQSKKLKTQVNQLQQLILEPYRSDGDS